MSFEFVALSPLLLHCLRGGVARWLTATSPVLTPLHEVVSVWQSCPIIMSNCLLGIDRKTHLPSTLTCFTMLTRPMAPSEYHGSQMEIKSRTVNRTVRRENYLILLGIFRKLAFYH